MQARCQGGASELSSGRDVLRSLALLSVGPMEGPNPCLTSLSLLPARCLWALPPERLARAQGPFGTNLGQARKGRGALKPLPPLCGARPAVQPSADASDAAPMKPVQPSRHQTPSVTVQPAHAKPAHELPSVDRNRPAVTRRAALRVWGLRTTPCTCPVPRRRTWT